MRHVLPSLARLITPPEPHAGTVAPRPKATLGPAAAGRPTRSLAEILVWWCEMKAAGLFRLRLDTWSLGPLVPWTGDLSTCIAGGALARLQERSAGGSRRNGQTLGHGPDSRTWHCRPPRREVAMDGKAPARAQQRRCSAPRVVSPRNKVNIALPLSMIRAEDPMKMRPGDWISLAGLVTAAIGFSVVIRQLTRIGHASGASQAAGASPAAAGPDREGTGPVDGRSASPALEERFS